jgi:hypothetical protein
LAFGDDLRAFADHDHEEGDERRGDEENKPRKQIHREDEEQDADGNERGDDQLRQVLAVIGVQRFDALDGGGGQFAGALSARVGGTEFEDVIEEPLTQVGFDADGNGVCANFRDPGEWRRRGMPG